MSRFTEALVVSPLADGDTWVLLSPLSYEVGELGSGEVLTAPPGFMTDFASVPRLLWWVLPKWGKYGNAAVLHDWLYWEQVRNRPEADRIMLEAMEVLEVPAWQRWPIYLGVRAFGALAWLRNQWDRQAGFNRVQDYKQIKAVETSGRPGLLQRAWQRLQEQKS
ncbi:hypothetical protein DESUT3_30870 [Desulfuromonas versatilis]|uniref:DUF1353 domain-containing protein n=1 Tax=Desulfuromonas versatilis TaxID=2802975 RepID=A0ABM8HZ03_9BACT|nr:DUF1353 domain-containing protein [Desulfuromonas versatilis]BCR06018.1 hypothetical protein DESUT3_30870 [Desulfuromonas versatilis]